MPYNLARRPGMPLNLAKCLVMPYNLPVGGQYWYKVLRLILWSGGHGISWNPRLSSHLSAVRCGKQRASQPYS